MFLVNQVHALKRTACIGFRYESCLQNKFNIHERKRFRNFKDKNKMREDVVFQYDDGKERNLTSCFVWGYASTGALGTVI